MSGQSGDAAANLLNTPDIERKQSSAEEAAFRAPADMKGESVTQGLWLENVHRLERAARKCMQ